MSILSRILMPYGQAQSFFNTLIDWQVSQSGACGGKTTGEKQPVCAGEKMARGRDRTTWRSCNYLMKKQVPACDCLPR
jgi:hypothetical protein